MISVSSLHPASGPSEQRMPGGTISPSVLFFIYDLIANITLYAFIKLVIFSLDAIWSLNLFSNLDLFFQYFGFYVMKVSNFDRSLTQLRGLFVLCLVSTCENLGTPLLSFCKLLDGMPYNDPAIPTKRCTPPPKLLHLPSVLWAQPPYTTRMPRNKLAFAQVDGNE